MNKKIDLFYTALHLPVDILAVSLAFMVSYWVRAHSLEDIYFRLPYEDYVKLLYTAVPLWIALFVLQGLYNRRHLFGTLQNVPHIAVSSLAGWASFVVFLTFLKNEQTFVFPRLMLIYILVFGVVFVFAGRLFLRFLQFLLRSIGVGRRKIMILGGGEVAEKLEAALLDSEDSSRQLVKRLDSVTTEELSKSLRKYKVDELIVADHRLSDNQVLEYLITAQNAQVQYQLVPNMFEVQASNVTMDALAGVPLMTFRQTPLDGWGRILKRVIDVFLSIIGLIILSPLFLLLAIIILITDPGPIIYGHTRVGRNGKPFKLYKFRSMITKYCTGPGFNPKSQIEIFTELGRHDLVEEFKRDHKVKDDPRISKIGKIMRKTRLDELPQLFNVVRGDLSLVGPRAITEEELKRYGRWSSYLLSIKPGITGLWQVSGGSNVSYEERVKLDSHYVQNWTLMKDFIIIIKTVLTVLRGGDGY